MSEMGVGRTAEGSAKPETEEKGPARTLPRRFGAPDPEPRVRALSTHSWSGSASRPQVQSPARPLRSQAPRGNSERPNPRKQISEVPAGRTPTWPSPTENWAHQVKQQQPLEPENPKGRACARSHRGRFRRFHSTLGRLCLRLLHHFPARPGPQSWPGCALPGRTRARH